MAAPPTHSAGDPMALFADATYEAPVVVEEGKERKTAHFLIAALVRLGLVCCIQLQPLASIDDVLFY
jgi:hypothetical protein